MVSGCAGAVPRIENGVFRAPAAFRVTLPASGWDVAAVSGTELELRHRDGRAGILANAECGERPVRGDLGALARRLFVGLRERKVLENGTAAVNGMPAQHAVMEAQVSGRDDRVRLEAYVLKDERCVYDLVYVAPAAAFAASRAEFQRFVESFVRE
jgi:hypothetical protein